MKGILIQQKVFKAIDGRYTENISEEKRLENDEFAYSSIILNLSDSVIRKVGKLETAKELWDRLEELFTETSLPSKLFLLEKFFRYKLDLSKNIDENVDEFTKLVQDIKLTGDKNIDDYTPIVLLNAIPETYSDVKAAIKYGRDNVSLDTVINGLKSKEMDIKTNKTNQSTSEVNFVRGRTKNRNPDYKYRKGGRSRSRSKSRSKSRGRDERPRDDRYRDEKPRDDKYRERRCYNCGGRGHYIKDCRKPKRDNRNNSKHDGDDANFVSDSNGEVYMISDINNVQSSVNMHEWLIDSGCSFHMSPYKEIFSNYKTDNFGFVAMANEKLCGIKGLGDVCVTFDNGYTLTLKNVRHVPDLCHNLMSCSALEEEGLEGRWGRGVMKIMKGALNVFKAERKRNLYMCSVKYDCFTASVSVDDKASLWHRRLGHISLKGLDLLHKNGLLPDKFKDLNFCDDCVLGKQHKFWFTKIFLGEALLTAAYLVNRSPSVPLLGKTPECVWSKSDIDLSSLRIFGCAAFALVNGNKLDPRSQKCVFIGYPEGVKGYRLWVRDQPGLRVVISRNVVFNESEFPCLTKIPRTEEEYNIELTFNKVEETNEDNQQGEGFREETRDIEAGQTNRNSENPEHIDNYSLARDRERRERRIPSRFRDFHLALNSEDSEPTSYDDALKSPKSEFWIKAMKEEMKSLKDNKTWVLVPKPKNTSIVDSKWIFKLKNENDSLRYKANENIYMAQPCGFIDNRNPEHLSKDQSPKSDSEKKLMEKVPYSNAIGSVMYLMVCTRPDIAYAELVSLSLQVPHRRPAMMIARDPYLGPGSSPQVLVQGGE
ncbi:UNVERIFIED_CONTAM: Retrovirus-related Pol polyprotein from transposon TNT 1-94 [Sesamum radiatum]|uniref:Retrovirus-related Pol polyprotein from transposon TNT 1-94 n=2 Tax=Sesamum radiatum TaxID=300843 RepID=A0AAW2QE72_SESRA